MPGSAIAVSLAAGCALGTDNSLNPVGFADGGAESVDGDTDGGAPRTPPSLPPTVTALVPPPPISGGTMLVTLEGNRAVAADPDRDLVYGVDLTARKLLYTVTLQAGDEPGRVAEDPAYGLVHVALRGGGALVTIDEKTGAIVARRPVCPAPRGVTWQWGTDLVWVACATGELVAFPSRGGAAVHRWVIERDLRDVVIDDQGLAVTTFRSAEILRIDGSGAVISRYAPEPFPGTSTHVMWRALATSGLIITVHQAESESIVQTHSQGGYGGGGCGGVDFASTPQPVVPPLNPEAGPLDPDAGLAGDDAEPPPPVDFDSGPGCAPPIVTAQYSVLDGSGKTRFAAQFAGVLPVDMAISRDGKTVAFAAPGNAYTEGLSSFFRAAVPTSTPYGTFFGEVVGLGQLGTQGAGEQPIAVAFDAQDEIVLQSREPARLWLETGSGAYAIPLSSQTRRDTGHDVFHTQAGALIACASCHPEGGDDGHVWQLDGDPRRTPSLRGTIEGTAPYHWPGDQPNFVALTNDVYTKRMDGLPLDQGQMTALSSWVDRIPAPPAPSWVDAAAAQRGKAIFERGDVGCTLCHSGAKHTNNLTLDVGTGGAFQVPPLVGVGWRTPLLHDGCATTIADRFGRCGTAVHGFTSSLSAQDIGDLSTYLETL
ncbi:MAG TPA: cytochrome-c peroxidase [Polyangiaceae bacterium]